jgi:purine-binding chemotaxis protein CheW
MVDLVKIRKKAKQKAEGERQKAEGRRQKEEAPAVETAAAPTPAPVPNPESRIPNLESRIPNPEPRIPTPEPRTTKLQRFLDSAGKRKTVEAPKAAAATGQLELLTFYIAGEMYAIDIENVIEIITPRTVTQVPNADPSVVGIFSLRGTVVTLLDVRRRLGHTTEQQMNDETRVVVVQQDGEFLGFTVDRVLRVVKADPDSVEPHPVVHASEQDESVRGVFRLGDTLTILLDLGKLVARN